MAFSMHSHSGQFCPGHAKDGLEAIIQCAISLKFRLLCLSEHMPRTADSDLYPEEIEAGHTIALLRRRHEAYVNEATRLREKYKDQIDILIGFEADWIRQDYAHTIRELMLNKEVVFFIGSIHHVHGIPIDYDKPLYLKARSLNGHSDTELFEDYFDEQYKMLMTMGPPVVGHFDLIRLYSDDKDVNWKEMGGEVWRKIIRNLGLIKQQGGLLEVNSAALRKGMREPYPSKTICEEFMKMGGMFTLSDDSHGIDHVGLNYKRTFDYLHDLGLQNLHFLSVVRSQGQNPSLTTASVPLLSIRDSVLLCPSTKG